MAKTNYTDPLILAGSALAVWGMLAYHKKWKVCRGEWLTSMGVNRHPRFLKLGFPGSPTAQQMRDVKPGDLFKVVYANVRSNLGVPPDSFIVVPVKIQVGGDKEFPNPNLMFWPVCRLATPNFAGSGALISEHPIPYSEAFSPHEFIRMDYTGPVTLDDIFV